MPEEYKEGEVAQGLGLVIDDVLSPAMVTFDLINGGHQVTVWVAVNDLHLSLSMSVPTAEKMRLAFKGE